MTDYKTETTCATWTFYGKINCVVCLDHPQHLSLDVGRSSTSFLTDSAAWLRIVKNCVSEMSKPGGSYYQPSAHHISKTTSNYRIINPLSKNYGQIVGPAYYQTSDFRLALWPKFSDFLWFISCRSLRITRWILRIPVAYVVEPAFWRWASAGNKPSEHHKAAKITA